MLVVPNFIEFDLRTDGFLKAIEKLSGSFELFEKSSAEASLGISHRGIRMPDI